MPRHVDEHEAADGRLEEGLRRVDRHFALALLLELVHHERPVAAHGRVHRRDPRQPRHLVPDAADQRGLAVVHVAYHRDADERLLVGAGRERAHMYPSERSFCIVKAFSLS